LQARLADRAGLGSAGDVLLGQLSRLEALDPARRVVLVVDVREARLDDREPVVLELEDGCLRPTRLALRPPLREPGQLFPDDDGVRPRDGVWLCHSVRSFSLASILRRARKSSASRTRSEHASPASTGQTPRKWAATTTATAKRWRATVIALSVLISCRSRSAGVTGVPLALDQLPDRKSTRLNSSHVKISY